MHLSFWEFFSGIEISILDAMEPSNDHLRRSLTPFMVWGLGVGYVISGNYFGWNLGLAQGGTLGMAVALVLVIILYITFTFSYTELSCAIPKAGGAFDYAQRALGNNIGFLVGMAQNIEFIFAPPAIAFAIGAYFNLYFPAIPNIVFSLTAYLLFLFLNVAGVKVAASFELGITLLAVIAVILFGVLASQHFEWRHLTQNPLPHGWLGAFGAVPFAIWFFLGIEGVANLAEEVINPRRTILLGFGSAIITLVILCLVTFTTSVGIAGWEAIVFRADGTQSDSPLPLAWQYMIGGQTWQYKLFVAVGLFGLVASFHGLMLAAGRSTMEFGRAGYAPAFLGKVHRRYQTPANALAINAILGTVALFTGKTSEIITISVFGALTLYIISMIAMLRLRRTEPGLTRPFRVPLYPASPLIALFIASVCFGAVAIYNMNLLLIYLGLLALSFIIFRIQRRKSPQNNL
jgi:ethanolamine permease